MSFSDPNSYVKCFLCNQWQLAKHTEERIFEGEKELVCFACLHLLELRAESLEMEAIKREQETPKTEADDGSTGGRGSGKSAGDTPDKPESVRKNLFAEIDKRSR